MIKYNCHFVCFVCLKMLLYKQFRNIYIFYFSSSFKINKVTLFLFCHRNHIKRNKGSITISMLNMNDKKWKSIRSYVNYTYLIFCLIPDPESQ